MAKIRNNTNLPGSFYQRRNSRWWWSVRLPGEKRAKGRPLKPKGSKYATKDKAVAVEVAKMLLQEAVRTPSESEGSNTLSELVKKYLTYCQEYYQPPSREPENIRYALDTLLEIYPALPVEEFGPLKLKDVRQAMIDKGWSRSVVNRRVGMIKRLFKWAVSNELAPVTQHQKLATVEGLKQGRSEVKESKPIMPVEARHVSDVLPYTSAVVASMIQIQLLTGMRSSELCSMRPCDIETSGKTWFYKPVTHKTAYRGHQRVVAIGPKAQELIKPYLNRKTTEYMFSPVEAEKEHRGKTKSTAGKKYNKDSYRRAVEYAINAARKAGVEVPDFTPHQLRHTAATRIRKELGLDAARAALGHRNMRITDDYAELDKGLAAKAAGLCG